MATQLSRRALLATAVVVTGTLLTPLSAQAAPDPVRALEQAAHPLRHTEPGRDHADLRALGRMIGAATVVGLGEATHGSHEFFAMKERVFRYLVQEKGFRAFALEMSWPAGLKINEFLQTGNGDARAIAKETLSGSPWDREEFVSLIEWMREHNRRNPGRTVHFVGDDLGAPRVGAEFFDRVTGYLPALAEYYTGLRPLDDVFAYLGKPVRERRLLAERARQALDLISGLPRHGEQFELAVQNARSIAETAHFLTVDPADPAGLAEFQRFRDEVMARNVLWWQRRTGHKILVSAHNGHVGYVSGTPAAYPKTQGAFLRDRLGADYLPIGFSFDRGSFLSKDTALGGDWKQFSVGAAEPGSNEHTLDRVRHRDFYLDLRTAPPSARAWLDTARPTRDIGTGFPVEPSDLALRRAYDVLIHLHQVRAAEPRK
ncbi:erythromycin esterase family protein [Crossiella cryophila]|uniref:Erythromycin esterase n=1 Tax=Crossiella cryophila TaxID=43355 RepID=A0A7W7FQS0_9PSEU|nr:erythromycin esterase family protein [Crossiella cryophila]MBB4674120.1 erythromycin esterase [Crossiella cryophila]